MHSVYTKAVPVLKKLDFDGQLLQKTYKREQAASQMSRLQRAFPNVHGLDDTCRLPVLIALSYYPELRHATIVVKRKKIRTTMVARPLLKALFKKKNKHYELVINNDPGFKGVPFADVPFNAKIGVVGHELAHFLDYEHKNNFQLLRTLFQYLYKKGRTRYEHAIDYLTIFKGLGWQLKDWAQWSMYDSPADEGYKQFKRSVYLGPREIHTHIERLVQKNGGTFPKDNISSHLP